MKKIIFDEKKIDTCMVASKFGIKYHLLHADKNTTHIPLDEKLKLKYCSSFNKVCFSGLSRHLLDFKSSFKKSANRIVLCVDVDREKEYKLNKTERQWWATTCKRNGLFPKNIGSDYVNNGVFDISLKNIGYQKLYIYLIAARYVQEEPAMIRSAKHLVLDLDMDFFIALSVAHSFSALSPGHSMLNVRNYYDTRKNPNKINNFDLKLVTQLYKFINNNVSTDVYHDLKTLGHQFNLKSTLEYTNVGLNEYNKTFSVDKNDLLRKRLANVIRKGDLSKAYK